MERQDMHSGDPLHLKNFVEGLSNSDIAEKLFVAEKTVAKHINTLFAKLNLPDTNSNARRVQAVLHLLRNG